MRLERAVFRCKRGEILALFQGCVGNSDCDGLLLNPVKFKTITTLGDRSFAAAVAAAVAAAAAPQLWNSLPYAIRRSPSVASFKSDGQEKSTKILISWQELKNQFLSFFVHR